MIPHLEQLEAREVPSADFPYTITEVAAPPTMDNFVAAMIDTQALFFLGQFPQLHLGVPYEGPNQIVRYDMLPGQFSAVTGQPANTVARSVFPVLGGEMPVIFVPFGLVEQGNQTQGGMTWEQTSFQHGWWYQDALSASDYAPGHAFDPSYMIPGPQFGQVFAAPEFLLADWLFLNGDLSF